MPELITIEEAARITGFPSEDIQYWAKSHKITSYSVTRDSRLVDLANLREFISHIEHLGIQKLYLQLIIEDKKEEADEIIGTMPSWIVRWGITLIFVLLALLFLGCYFIRYPQTVTGTITLTTVPPPVDVTAPHTGIAEAVATEGQTVAKGDVLVLYATRDEYREVQHLEKSLWLPTDETLPDDLRFSYAAYRANGSEETLQQLTSAIAQWKAQHVVEAPADGHVTLLNSGPYRRQTTAGELLASILPAAETEVVGRLHLPAASRGDVEPGQKVNVKLNGFPYMEFGILRGVVRTISAVPDGTQGYIVTVAFPDALRTSYKKELPLIHGMDGTAEIITKEMRLIEHFIQPVRALYDKNAE